MSEFSHLAAVFEWGCFLPSLIIHHTHTHINGPFSGTTRVSRYQKGKTNLDFTEARDIEWQWNLLVHMQVSISLQTDNHTSTPLLSFFTGRMPFLPPNQQHQSTEGKQSAEGKNHPSLQAIIIIVIIIIVMMITTTMFMVLSY